MKKEQKLEINEDWTTPDFCKIKTKQTKRISPYLESEIWQREEVLALIKYEPNMRNKAILSLMWDLNARPHEITLLRIKNLRLKDRYGEGEIPYEAKTGTGPILLMMSFPYVRDWLNQHPFRNECNARLVCNLHNGSPIKPKTIWNIMKQLRTRIIRMLESNEIKDRSERQNIDFLIKTKKFNPYCFRHSSISSDSDYLPEYALKKKVRWSMNSRQGNRYIKTRMGQELKNRILAENGIVQNEDVEKKVSNMLCGKCGLSNQFQNKYCSKCSYPLTLQAYEEIKDNEYDITRKLEMTEKEINSLKQLEADNADVIATLSDRVAQLSEEISLSKIRK